MYCMTFWQIKMCEIELICLRIVLNWSRRRDFGTINLLTFFFMNVGFTVNISSSLEEYWAEMLSLLCWIFKCRVWFSRNFGVIYDLGTINLLEIKTFGLGSRTRDVCSYNRKSIHTVQKLRVIFDKLLRTFDCFLSLYNIHAYEESF